MQDYQDFEKNRQRLIELIKNIDFAMLTTVDEDGSLRSRPMSVNSEIDENATLWFFTYGNSHKVLEIKQNSEVNASFSDIKSNKYVSVSGTAQLVRDREKIKQLWQPLMQAWFPQGIDTPDIALIKLSARKAEFWEGPSHGIAQAMELVKMLTGQPTNIGESHRVQL